MAITITDWGIEHNGIKKYDGAHIAGQGAGFRIWAIVEESATCLQTNDGYDWITSDDKYFKTADSGGAYVSAYNASAIEDWLQGVT